MKNYTYLLALGILTACSQSESGNAGSTDSIPIAVFGDSITEDGALPSSQVVAALEGVDSVFIKVTGVIEKVCQVKGCWMKMRVGDNQNMHVSFRDYGFFVPKDIDGKEAVIEGYAYIETMSVEELRHYAEDEGKSEDEIAAITEPEVNLSFVADGVIVKNYVIGGTSDSHNHNHDHDHGDHKH